MSKSIKVPLGLGGLLWRRPQREPKEVFHNDLEFLRDLAETGRLQIAQGGTIAAGGGVGITPPEGTTFFLLGAQISSDEVTTNIVELQNALLTRELAQLPEDTNYQFKLSMDKLVGNGVREYRIISSADGAGTLWGWFESTERKT